MIDINNYTEFCLKSKILNLFSHIYIDIQMSGFCFKLESCHASNDIIVITSLSHLCYYLIISFIQAKSMPTQIHGKY